MVSADGEDRTGLYTAVYPARAPAVASGPQRPTAGRQMKSASEEEGEIGPLDGGREIGNENMKERKGREEIK